MPTNKQIDAAAIVLMSWGMQRAKARTLVRKVLTAAEGTRQGDLQAAAELERLLQEQPARVAHIVSTAWAVR